MLATGLRQMKNRMDDEDDGRQRRRGRGRKGRGMLTLHSGGSLVVGWGGGDCLGGNWPGSMTTGDEWYWWKRWSRVVYRTRVVELSWTGRGPGSCGEESGLPRLESSGAPAPNRWSSVLSVSWAADAVAMSRLCWAIFFSYNCSRPPLYIHCYTAACYCIVYCLPGIIRRLNARLSLLSSSPSLRPRAADLRKPNSDSCRYGPPTHFCLPPFTASLPCSIV
jgi:hypothetical protein